MSQQPPQQHSDSDVISFLTNIITLGDVNSIDDSPDKIIRSTDTQEPLMQKVGDAYLPCALYGTKATDVYIVNPFTMGNTGEYSWFSKSRTTIFGYCIVGIMRKIIDAAVSSKEPEPTVKGRGRPKHTKMEDVGIDAETELELIKGGITNPNEFWELAAPFVPTCDEKLLKELETITAKMDDFIAIHYDKTNRTSKFKCLLFSDVQKKAFPKIRVGSWNTLTTMLTTILKVTGDDLSEFDYKHKFHGADTFEGLCSVLIELYDRATPAIQVAFPHVEVASKINALKSHMKYFGQYNSSASWCRNVVGTPVTAVQGQTHPTPYGHTPGVAYSAYGAGRQPAYGSPPAQYSAPNMPAYGAPPVNVHHQYHQGPAYGGGHHAQHRCAPQYHQPYGRPPQVPQYGQHQAPHQPEILSAEDQQSRTNPFVRANRSR